MTKALKSVLKHPEIGDLKLSGILEDRIRLGLEHLLCIGTNDLIFGTIERSNLTPAIGFGADQAGRWLELIPMMEKYYGVNLNTDSVLKTALQYQQSSGSFSSPPPEKHGNNIWFGDGRAMIGLLTLYKYTGNKQALKSAEKLGEFFINHYPDLRKTKSFMPEGTSSGLEGLVMLYDVTGKKKYSDIARFAAETSTLLARNQSAGHPHCFLATVRGILEMYRLDGDASYIGLVDRVWEKWHRGSDWLNTGALHETCTLMDDLFINLRLWRYTGEGKYVHAAEQILYHLYFMQVEGGGFLNGRKLDGRKGWLANGCCSFAGVRALLEAALHIYTYVDDIVWVNFFTDSSARIILRDKGDLQVMQETRYPSEGTVNLVLDMGEECEFELRIRIPSWTKLSSIKINGAKVDSCVMNDYVCLRRCWKAGDRVTVEFPVEYRTSTNIKGETVFLYGPLTLCVLDHYNRAARELLPYELVDRANGVSLLERNGFGDIEVDRKPIWFPYELQRTEPLIIGDKTYKHCLGIHANGEAVYRLTQNYEWFEGYVALEFPSSRKYRPHFNYVAKKNHVDVPNWKQVTSGSAVVYFFLDGAKVYDSGIIHTDDPPKPYKISIKNSEMLRIVVDDAGDGNLLDSVILAEARLSKSGKPSVFLGRGEVFDLNFKLEANTLNRLNSVPWMQIGDPRIKPQKHFCWIKPMQLSEIKKGHSRMVLDNPMFKMQATSPYSEELFDIILCPTQNVLGRPVSFLPGQEDRKIMVSSFKTWHQKTNL